MLHADNAYNRGRAMGLRASLWFKQGMLEKARLEASRAVDAYGEVGATKGIEECTKLLGKIGELDLGGTGEPFHKRCHLRALMRRLKVKRPLEDLSSCPGFFGRILVRVTNHYVSTSTHSCAFQVHYPTALGIAQHSYSNSTYCQHVHSQTFGLCNTC